MTDADRHPSDRRYFKEHFWVSGTVDTVRVGISAYASEALGDIVFADLPSVGDTVSPDQPCGEIESVKSVSSIYSPVSGEVTSANSSASQSPEIINESPNGDGWLFEVRMSNPIEYDELLDSEAYVALIDSL